MKTARAAAATAYTSNLPSSQSAAISLLQTSIKSVDHSESEEEGGFVADGDGDNSGEIEEANIKTVAKKAKLSKKSMKSVLKEDEDPLRGVVRGPKAEKKEEVTSVSFTKKKADEDSESGDSEGEVSAEEQSNESNEQRSGSEQSGEHPADTSEESEGKVSLTKEGSDEKVESKADTKAVKYSESEVKEGLQESDSMEADEKTAANKKTRDTESEEGVSVANSEEETSEEQSSDESSEVAKSAPESEEPDKSDSTEDGNVSEEDRSESFSKKIVSVKREDDSDHSVVTLQPSQSPTMQNSTDWKSPLEMVLSTLTMVTTPTVRAAYSSLAGSVTASGCSSSWCSMVDPEYISAKVWQEVRCSRASGPVVGEQIRIRSATSRAEVSTGGVLEGQAPKPLTKFDSGAVYDELDGEYRKQGTTASDNNARQIAESASVRTGDSDNRRYQIGLAGIEAEVWPLGGRGHIAEVIRTGITSRRFIFLKSGSF